MCCDDAIRSLIGLVDGEEFFFLRRCGDECAKSWVRRSFLDFMGVGVQGVIVV